MYLATLLTADKAAVEQPAATAAAVRLLRAAAIEHPSMRNLTFGLWSKHDWNCSFLTPS
jgi:hypothetical protein